MKKAPEVGQTVYMVSARRRWGEERIMEPVTVTKVGRKYFYIERYSRDVPVSIETWEEKSEFSKAHFYASTEEYENKLERQRLLMEISEAFRYGSGPGYLSLDEVREIHKKITGDGNG